MGFFDDAVQIVLAHEGGYVNDQRDSGGATNWGISLKFLKDFTSLNTENFNRFDLDKDGDIDFVDVKNMPRDDAIYLYRKAFWDRYDYGKLVSYPVATKVFDLSVNMGGAQANKCLQRAVRAATMIQLDEDGVLGPKSFSAINGADMHSLLAALKSEAAGFYRLLVKADPKLARFLTGWLNRAYY